MDASTLQRNLGGYPGKPDANTDHVTCQLLAAPIYFREDTGIEETADLALTFIAAKIHLLECTIYQTQHTALSTLNFLSADEEGKT
ncbi:hypothetical protein STEG23_012817, partial [Scotinomys teguina]